MAESESQTEEIPLKKNVEDFQDILEIVGSQGKYQRRYLYWMLCPMMAVFGLIYTQTLFLLFIPEHHCSIPGSNGPYYTFGTSNDTFLPHENGADGRPRFSRCSQFDPKTIEQSDNETQIECKNGWAYDTSDYDKTIPSQYNWVCDKSEYATHVFTAASLGSTCGQVIFGILADKFGRRIIFFVCLFMKAFFLFGSLFLPGNFVIYIVVIFIASAGGPLMFDCPGLILSELSDNDFRSSVYSISWMVWVAGSASMPLIAWLVRDWFWIGVISVTPAIILFFVSLAFLPESPRWLCAMGRFEEAQKVIEMVARVNGNSDKAAPEEIKDMLQQFHEHHKRNSNSREGFWSFFGHWRLARNTIMLSTAWAVNDTVYESIMLNSPNMFGNQFLNYFLLAVTEVPAEYLGGYLLERLGRRWTLVTFFGLCAVGCFTASVLVFYPEQTVAFIIVVIFAKFCISLTYLAVYIQSTELFPTNLRSTGMGVCSTAAGVVSTYSPQLVYAGQFHAGAPYITMGLMVVVATFAAMIIPETLHQNLPETIEEANAFGKHHKFWSRMPQIKRSVLNSEQPVDFRQLSDSNQNAISS